MRNLRIDRPAGWLLIALLAGCGGGTATPGAHREWAGRSLPAAGTYPGYRLAVSTARQTYRVGEPITITVAVTNTQSEPATIAYNGGATILQWGYLLARNGRIATYEYWGGHGWAFPAYIRYETFAPGETKRYELTCPLNAAKADPEWPLPAGSYQVYARGPVDFQGDIPRPLSEPVTITITP